MPFASKGLWEDKTGAGLGSCFLANPRLQSCKMSQIWQIYLCKILEGWLVQSAGNQAVLQNEVVFWEDKTGAGLGSCFLANPRGGALVKMYRYKGISNPKDLGDKNANNL